MTSEEIQRYNQSVAETLKEGDLVSFQRGCYDHFGVYSGKNKVIHLSVDDESGISQGGCFSDKTSNKGCVKEDDFLSWPRTVRHVRATTIQNGLLLGTVSKSCKEPDKNWERLSTVHVRKTVNTSPTGVAMIRHGVNSPVGDGQEIVQRARQKLGKTEYNVCTKNCEHLATWCRYDTAWSEQVFSKLSGAADIGLKMVETAADLVMKGHVGVGAAVGGAAVVGTAVLAAVVGAGMVCKAVFVAGARRYKNKF